MRKQMLTVRKIVAQYAEMKSEVDQLEKAIKDLRKGSEYKENEKRSYQPRYEEDMPDWERGIENDARIPVKLLYRELNQKREDFNEFLAQLMEVHQ